MGASEFAWGNLPKKLLAVIAVQLGADSAAPSAVNAAFVANSVGPLPTERLVKAVWPQVRDAWVLGDSESVDTLTALLDASEASRGTRVANPEPRDFIAKVPNTVRLRAAVITWLIALGSTRSAGTGEEARRATGSATGEPSSAEADADIAYAASLVEAMADGDLAPQTGLDFARLDSFGDLTWTRFAAELFGQAQDLLPGDLLSLLHLDDYAASGGQRARFAIIRRIDESTLLAELGMPEMLPGGTGYTEAHATRLAELGWRQSARSFQVTGTFDDELDDIVAILVQTLREVFLIDSPADLSVMLKEPEVAEGMPSPPSRGEPVFVKSPARGMMLVSGILRALGASIVPGPDPTTMALRLGPWLAWAHIGMEVPALEVVMVVTDQLPRLQDNDQVAATLIELSTHTLRWSRPVVSGSRLLLVQQLWVNATSREALEAAFAGMARDAGAALESVAPLLATPGGDQGLAGGYL